MSPIKLDGKRVLVTGADGFIGSHLVETLVPKCAKVRALAHYNSFNDLGWLDAIDSSGEVEIFSGDVRDPAFCRKLSKGMDVLFHLAALIGIPFSYIAPASYVETNVVGTLNICQAAMDSGCERVIHTSTSEVYGTARYVPIDENHPLQPQSPYSASKIGAEAVALSFFHSFGLPVLVVRPFNTYGPRQSARAVIPTIITQLISGQRVVHLGDLSPTRDFNYVLDTCRAFIVLAECGESVGEITNIGSNSEISIRDLFALITRLAGVEAMAVEEHERVRPANSEVRRLWCDNSKIKRITGFSPSYSLEEGLNMTIEWFRKSENIRRYKEKKYNV